MNGARVYVWSGSVPPGERPVAPYAARSRSVDTTFDSPLQNDSSDTTYETPAFGRKTVPAVWLNAELRSARPPSWTNSFSLNPSCSCRKNPNEICCPRAWLAVVVVAADTRLLEFATRPWPVPPTAELDVLIH